MGVLRLYLALCVVATHSGNNVLPWTMHHGVQAVQIFYLISGFYMAFVFEKYQNLSEFYFSRFLRIFIPYWVIAFSIILISVVSGLTFGYWGELTPYFEAHKKNEVLGVLFVTFTNVTIFFQDTVLFLSNDLGESLSFTSNYRTSQHPLWHYLIIPQAWSVAVELLFYLSVPLLMGLKPKALVVVILISLLSRIVCYEVIGWSGDPWSFRFFPFELALFSMGMLSCHMWKKHEVFFTHLFDGYSEPTIKVYVLQIVLMLLFFYYSVNATNYLSSFIDSNYLDLLSYLFWSASLPFFFSLSQKNKRDRFIGELSYPVYLVHYFIIYIVSIILSKLEISYYISKMYIMSYTGLISACLSIIVSLVVVKAIIYPLDKRRYSLAKQMSNKIMHA